MDGVSVGPVLSEKNLSFYTCRVKVLAKEIQSNHIKERRGTEGKEGG